MGKNLLIVESPAKAKTIEKILGKDFSVKSSFGHIRDLEKGNAAVDVEHNYQPKYIISPEKRKVVKELKDAVKKSDEVWLATDDDREGEAISWHLCEVLGLDEKNTNRIVFREITSKAIQSAIQAPGRLDVNLVNAQQARRILDRLVGFDLSGLLWRKVKGKLSAGRVQSVAVKLLVDREREIQKFEPKPFFTISALFEVDGPTHKKAILKAKAPKNMDTQEDARAFLESCKNAGYSISDIEIKPTKRKPAAPFTTSTLQQEASRKMGFAVARTMRAAQRLYEAGHITYMRTDSTNLSDTALAEISKVIESNFGQNYLSVRKYKSKKGAQEAHEAIRPTYSNKRTVSLGRDEDRLYDLIWKRTVASQMADAIIEKTVVKIDISTRQDGLIAEGQVVKFDGFLKVYLESKDDDQDDDTKDMLPPLTIGQVLNFREMTALERFTRPPARYTEASLVKKLEAEGIGRPSTYAPTISKIMEESRGYVVKESREGVERNYTELKFDGQTVETVQRSEITGATKNRLYPTDIGMVVSDFLTEHFDEIMNYGFTAKIEKKFDEISDGKLIWYQMVDDFYRPFKAKLDETMETADRASGERILGTDPKSGKTVLVRMTRFGKPAVQIGKPDELAEDEKPQYASLAPGQSLESVTFEDAMKLFQLPRTIGEYKGHPVEIHSGRFGPYIKYDGKFVSLKKTDDPYTVKIDRATELIQEKEKEDAPIAYYKDLPITKGKGRFGPFIKWNGLFQNVSPKKYDFDNLTEDQAIELAKAKEEKEANRYIQRWPEENLAIENGRWGPFIRWKKKSIKLPKDKDNNRMTPEQAKELTLEAVIKMVEAEIPDAFKKKSKKKAPAKKKAATKKK
ncbi:MAG TPA: type I DNA topoisomerase [Saprospiraceae bacterium]|nr:type I DNA topoisomerase [Saprospiraceae bacterium]